MRRRSRAAARYVSAVLMRTPSTTLRGIGPTPSSIAAFLSLSTGNPAPTHASVKARESTGQSSAANAVAICAVSSS